MLSSDILVFEYFKKKENDWASKKENALSYLKSKSPEEISSEFKNDRAFKQVTSYINSIVNNITENLDKVSLEEITKKIDSKNENNALNMIEKLIDAIDAATSNGKGTESQNEKYSAIAITAAIATAVLLSKYIRLEDPKEEQNRKK